MTPDMRPEAVELRLRKQGRLTLLCLQLAGPRRRSLASFGPLTALDENGSPLNGSTAPVIPTGNHPGKPARE